VSRGRRLTHPSLPPPPLSPQPNVRLDDADGAVPARPPPPPPPAAATAPSTSLPSPPQKHVGGGRSSHSKAAAAAAADARARGDARAAAKAAAAERAAAVARAAAERKRKSALFRKRNARGQPVMKHRIVGLLDKLEREMQGGGRGGGR
jgi:hypothetical protein